MKINYDHRISAHCETGVTSGLLRFYGYNYSEPMVFGLSASLYFVHIPFVNILGFPTTAFRPQPGVVFSRLMRLLGFKIHKKTFANKNKAVQQLDSLLEKGIPTGCVTSTYHLTYLPTEYRYHFNAHNICVVGKEGDDYLVSDPICAEILPISSHDLLRARFAKGSFPPRGKLYWVESLPKKEPDLNKLMRKAILKNCKRMIHEPGPVPFIGVNAFKYLGNRIPKYPAMYGEKKATLHLVNLLRTLEERGTGGAGFRFLYAAFLQEAAKITGISELDDFSQRLTDIGDHWRVFAMECGRVFKKRSSENTSYQTIGDLVKEIGKEEELFFRDLEKLIKSQPK